MRNRGISRSVLVYGIPAVFIAVVLILIVVRVRTQQVGPGNEPTQERSDSPQPSGPGSAEPRQQPTNQPQS